LARMRDPIRHLRSGCRGKASSPVLLYDLAGPLLRVALGIHSTAGRGQLKTFLPCRTAAVLQIDRRDAMPVAGRGGSACGSG
jgi:hypothetical protein